MRLFSIAISLLTATLVSGCGQANAQSDRQGADHFAQIAFEKFRARELRKLPLSSQYNETKIRSAESIAEQIPMEKPISSNLTQIQITNDGDALVRRQYNYTNKSIEVSVGMERSGGVGAWELYGLSVTPATGAK